MKIEDNRVVLTFAESRKILAELKRSEIKNRFAEIVPKQKTKLDYTIDRIESLGYKVEMYATKKYRATKGEEVIYGTISGIFKQLFYT